MKLNYRKTMLIGLAFYSISAFWQLYEAVIPLILSQTFEIKETFTGVIMSLDNVLALLLLPVFGMLSDRTSTRLGKRTPYIIIGTALSVILMLFVPVADNASNFILYIVTLVFLLISMCIYRSPAVALMPDLTPKHLRSQANAIINLMGTLGTLSTLLLISVLVPRDGRPDYSLLFMAVAFIMIISVGILTLTVHEPDSIKMDLIKNKSTKEEAQSMKISIFTENTEKKETINVKINETISETINDTIFVVKGLKGDMKNSLIFLLFSIFFWFAAFNAVTTAFSRYAVNVLGFKGGSYAGVLFVAMAIATAGYIPMGYVSSHLGRKKTIIIGIIIMTFSYAIAVLLNTYSPWIYIIFAFTGFGWAAINVNAYPMVVEMSSGSEIGKYTGLYYTFSTAAQIVTPILSGFLLENISYRTLFPYATVCSLLSLLTMLRVKHGDVVPQKKSGILESFDIDD